MSQTRSDSGWWDTWYHDDGPRVVGWLSHDERVEPHHMIVVESKREADILCHTLSTMQALPLSRDGGSHDPADQNPRKER